MLCRQPLRTIQPQVERDMCHARTALIWHGAHRLKYPVITLHVSHTIAVSLYFECIFGVLTGNIVDPKVLKSVSELDVTHKGSVTW